MMEQTAALSSLPTELIVKILTYLDIGSIDSLENVSTKFRELISTSIQMWKQKIRLFCQADSQFKHVLSYSEYTRIKKSSKTLRSFYNCLLKINENMNNGNFSKRELLCLESEIKGRKVVQSPEWNRHHNYRGVYDMIFLDGRLCASVYDTIQIWDTRDYSLTHMFTKDILDQDHSQTTCFTLNKEYLICGAENGYVKLIDINTEKVVARERVNSNYLSDVKFKNDILLCLDWFGNIHQWKILPGHVIQNITKEGSFPVPRLLQPRDIERLMDFGSDLLVTTFKTHITIYRGGSFVLSFPVYSDVFCIDLKDDFLAFGCKGETREETTDRSIFINPVAGIINFKYSPPRILYMRTKDNDPVISLQLFSRFLMLGDVNGEIHIINIEKIKFPEVETFIDLDEENKEVGVRMIKTLRSHGYRDFIWALKSDGYRIFSGDETGKIIVHDFLMFEENNEDKPNDKENLGEKSESIESRVDQIAATPCE